MKLTKAQREALRRMATGWGMVLMRKNSFVILFMLLLGCSSTGPKKMRPDAEIVPPASVSRPERAIAELAPIFTRRGAHPAVAAWYYKLHPRAFQCKNGNYGCSECPVGKPDRVIEIRNHDKAYDVPWQVNAAFACMDINMLVPVKGAADDDVFLCEREPADGFVLIDGHRVSCGSTLDNMERHDLGTIVPGQSATIELGGGKE